MVEWGRFHEDYEMAEFFPLKDFEKPTVKWDWHKIRWFCIAICFGLVCWTMLAVFVWHGSRTPEPQTVKDDPYGAFHDSR